SCACSTEFVILIEEGYRYISTRYWIIAIWRNQVECCADRKSLGRIFWNEEVYAGEGCNTGAGHTNRTANEGSTIVEGEAGNTLCGIYFKLCLGHAEVFVGCCHAVFSKDSIRRTTNDKTRF